MFTSLRKAGIILVSGYLTACGSGINDVQLIQKPVQDTTPPEISILSEPSSRLSGVVSIEWTSTDQDIDSVVLQLSNDQGESWQELDSMVEPGSFIWNSIRHSDGIDQYNLRLVATDQSGNQAVYPLMQSLFSIDNTPPVIRNGRLTFADDSPAQITVSWESAEDGQLASNKLEYRVYYSPDVELGSIEAIADNGVAGSGWIEGLTSKIVAPVFSATRYYWNVVVRDSQGNVSLYDAASHNSMLKGELDNGFSDDGFHIAGGTAYGATMDERGRILVTGYSGAAASRTMTIWCFDSSGVACSDYGTGGVYQFPYASISEGRGIELDSTGNIIVAGQILNAAGNFDIATWRLSENGMLDSGFAANGVAIINDVIAPGSKEDVWDMTIGRDDDIIIAGQSYLFANLKFTIDGYVVRLTSDGKLDKSFNSDGIFIAQGLLEGSEIVSSVAYDPVKHNIVASGQSTVSELVVGMTLWQLTDEGALDTNFDEDGVASYELNDFPAGYSVTYDADGKIVATGMYRPGTGDDIGIIRLLPNGAVDKDFSTNGVFGLNSVDYSDSAVNVTFDSQNRLLITGSYGISSNNSESLLLRLTPDGAIDTTLASTGYITHRPEGYSSSGASHILLDKNDRPTLVGSSSTSSGASLTLWRYR